jgi:hypothetical protein
MRPHRVLLSVVVLLVTAGLTAVPVLPATAAAVTKIRGTAYDASCVFETREGPSVYFFAGQGVSGASGSGMFVEDEDGQLLLASEDAGSTTFAQDGFTASVHLVDVSTGRPAGTAVVEARTSDGPTKLIQVRDRPGNTWEEKGTRLETELVVSDVHAAVPGLRVVPGSGGCAAERTFFDVKTTNPSAQLLRDRDFGTNPCVVDGFRGAEVLLSRDRVEVVVQDGDDVQLASGTLRWRGPNADAEGLPLVDAFTEDVIGHLDVAVALERVGRLQRRSETGEGFVETVQIVPLLAHVTLTASDGRAGTASCAAVSVRSRLFLRP